MKLLVVLIFIAILVALGSAFLSMNRGTGSDSKSTVRALSWRIGISIALFAFLFFAYKMGWIQPHGVTPQ